MIQLTTNWRVIATFIAFVVAISWGVALLIAGALTLSELKVALTYLGTATSAGILAAFLLNKYLWRIQPIKTILGIPDLSGRWEGWTHRTLEDKWYPSAHEISQSALDISAEAWGPKNWSRGTAAAIVTNSHGDTFEVIWSYKTEMTMHGEAGDTHSGVHVLRYSERDGKRYLTGKYINDRIRQDGTPGAVGYIQLVWVNHTRKGSLAFTNRADWAMPEPSVNQSNLVFEQDCAKAAQPLN